MANPTRRFPPPWSVEEQVRDNGQANSAQYGGRGRTFFDVWGPGGG